MIGRFGELPKERLDRPTLLGAIGSDDTIASRPIDLDRPERRGDAVEAELPAACRPQVSDPLRLATARHEVADAVNLEGAAERYGPRLARLPTRHDEHERSPESLHDRVYQVCHQEPGTNVPPRLRIHVHLLRLRSSALRDRPVIGRFVERVDVVDAIGLLAAASGAFAAVA